MGKKTTINLVNQDIDLTKLSRKELKIEAGNKYESLLGEGMFNEFQTHKNIDQIITYFTELKSKSEQYVREQLISIGKTYSENNIEFSTRQGYAMYDFESDAVYRELNEKLNARKELLKLAVKNKDMIFDSEGVEVPKVPVKGYTKDSLIIKY